MAATISSNALAAAGVTSQVQLFGVKVLSRTGSGPFSAILNGVLWAADHDADVINMSLGGGFAKSGNGRFVAAVQRTFNYAHRKGATVVAHFAADSGPPDGNLHRRSCRNEHGLATCRRLAALLVEDLGHGRPSQVKSRIQQSADDLGQPGTDPLYGKGQINVPRALGLQ